MKEVAEEEQIDILFGKKSRFLQAGSRPDSAAASSQSRPLTPQSSVTSLHSSFGVIGKASDMFPRQVYQSEPQPQMTTRSSQQFHQPIQQFSQQFSQSQQQQPPVQPALRLDMRQVMSGGSRPSSAGSYSVPLPVTVPSTTPATTPSHASESVSASSIKNY